MILTIDVLANNSPISDLELRLSKLFETLEETNSSATVFTNTTQSKLLKKIGVPPSIEIASTIPCNKLFSSYSAKKRRKLLLKSKYALEKQFKIEIMGFRAPNFQFYDDLWVDLWETGHFYSSSVSPGPFTPKSSIFKSPFVQNHILELPLQQFKGLSLPFNFKNYRKLRPVSKLLLPKIPRIFQIDLKNFSTVDNSFNIFDSIFSKLGPTTSIQNFLHRNIREKGLRHTFNS